MAVVIHVKKALENGYFGLCCRKMGTWRWRHRENPLGRKTTRSLQEAEGKRTRVAMHVVSASKFCKPAPTKFPYFSASMALDYKENFVLFTWFFLVE
jgi:hypothetical protein